MHLGQSHPPVLARESVETAVAERFDQFAWSNCSDLISLSRERQDGVGSGFHPAIYNACQVDAEEGEGRIGNRVNQAAAVFSGRF